MACCFSCFSKKDVVDADNSDPPRPHLDDHGKGTAGKTKIAFQRKNGALRGESDTPEVSKEGVIRQSKDGERPGEKTCEERPAAGSDLTIDSPPIAQSTSQAGAQSDPENKSSNVNQAKKNNLWAIAESRLSDAHKDFLLKGKSAQPIEKTMEDIRRDAKEHYKRNNTKENGDQEGKGKKFDAHEVSKKILIFTIQAQDLIKAVASFDPTGHASTAWSVVSFGLTLIRNDMERQDEILEASEFLAGVLSYHIIIENNYHSKDENASAGLEEALVRVYVAILQYIAEVEKAKGDNFMGRIQSSIATLIGDSLKELKTGVENAGETVDRWKALVQDAAQKEREEDILKRINEEVIKELQEIHMRFRDSEDQALLDWISIKDYSKIQDDKLQSRSPGTGYRLLESEIYNDWKTSPGKVLWLRGVAGCGKSVLCSTIINDVEKQRQNITFDVLGYWYFDFSDDASQYVTNLVRCLIRQLAPSPLPRSIQKWRENRKKNKQPSFYELLNALDDTIAQLRGEAFVVLDALDECPQNPKNERHSLLQFIVDLMRKHEKKLHLLVTSRPEPDILEKLDVYTTFDVEANLSEDVRTYVKSQLADGKLKQWKGRKCLTQNKYIHDIIETRLLEVPERRFRWAELQIKQLEKCHTSEDILGALQKMPASLEKLYQKVLLEDIDANNKETARKILTLLSFSLGPLPLDAVVTFASLEFPNSVIEICTTSLVTVNSKNIVRLAHFSVKEFLTHDYAFENVRHFHLSEELAHSAILDRLLSEILEYRGIRLHRFNMQGKSLLQYAAQFWGSHMNGFCKSNPPDNLQKKIDCILLDQQFFQNWVEAIYDGHEAYGVYGDFPEFRSALPMASKLGLLQTVKRLLQCNEPAFGEPWERAFYWAAEEGHLSLLALLLEFQGLDEIHDSRKKFVIAALLGIIDASKEGPESLEIFVDKLWKTGLLFTDSAPRQIYPDFGRRAANNKKWGPLLVKMLIARTESDVKFDLDAFLTGAARGGNLDKILKIVSDHQATGTKKLNSAIYGLLEHPELADLWLPLSVELSDPEWLLEAFARGANLELMETFLGRYASQTLVTNDILVAAARNEQDSRILNLLLNKNPELPITDDVFLGAVVNKHSGQGLLAFQILLGACGRDRLIGETIMNKILLTEIRGTYLLKELLLKRQAVFTSQDLLTWVTGRGNAETMQLVIDLCGPNITITRGILEDALSKILRVLDTPSIFSGKPEDAELCIRYILDMLGPDYAVTEDLLRITASNSKMSHGAMSKLLSRFPSCRVPKLVFLGAYENIATMKALLDQRIDDAPISEIVRKIARSKHDGQEVFELLIERGLVAADEALVENLAAHEGALRVILNHNPTVKITQRAFEAATSVVTMGILLKFENFNCSVTERMMEKLVCLNDGIVKARDSLDRLDLLLARFGVEVPINEEILLQAARSRSGASHTIRTLLREKRTLNLQQVWENIWQGSYRFSEQVSDELLVYTSLHVSKGLLEKIPYPETTAVSMYTPSVQDSSDDEISELGVQDPSDDESSTSSVQDSSSDESTYTTTWSAELPVNALCIEDDFLARLVWFLVERNFLFPQELMPIILERGHLKTIAVVLDHNPDINVTDELLAAGRKNLDFLDVMWLLYIFRHTPSLDYVGSLIHWSENTRKCHLPNCSVMHSSRDREIRQTSAWVNGDFKLWKV